MLKNEEWQLKYDTFNIKSKLTKRAKVQPEIECENECLKRAEEMTRFYIALKTAYEDTFYWMLPPGLFLSYFNRFSNNDSSFSFLSWNLTPNENLPIIYDILPSSIEIDLDNILEDVVTFLSNENLKNISLLDISLTGAKSSNIVSNKVLVFSMLLTIFTSKGCIL